MLIVKNPQFQSNKADIQAIQPTIEPAILIKFHYGRAKMWIFYYEHIFGPLSNFLHQFLNICKLMMDW